MTPIKRFIPPLFTAVFFSVAAMAQPARHVILISIDALRPAKGGTHGYYADFPDIMTGLVGCGAGLNKGVVIPEMGMQDIAPVIAALLGLSFEAPDGVLLPGMIRPVSGH